LTLTATLAALRENAEKASYPITQAQKLQKSHNKFHPPPPGRINGPTLMKSTATDIVGGDKTSYFTCPFQGSLEQLHYDETLRDLWAHCRVHRRLRKGLFQQGHLPCELGCEQGFADTAHRFLHYANSVYVNEELPGGNCTEPGC
jgi:hypothetical protein